jgi:ribosomal-protein-alanine N-acetyltransferase
LAVHLNAKLFDSCRRQIRFSSRLKNFEPIVLRKCTLREWRESDLEPLVRNANNPNVARNLRDIFPSPYTCADAERWLGAVKNLPHSANLAIDVAAEACGGIGLRFEQNEAEIGFWLGEPYWNRGITTEALSAFTRHAFETFPIQRIYACVFSWNTPSCRVFEKAGYKNHGLQENCSEKAGKKVASFNISILREQIDGASRARF